MRSEALIQANIHTQCSARIRRKKDGPITSNELSEFPTTHYQNAFLATGDKDVTWRTLISTVFFLPKLHYLVLYLLHPQNSAVLRTSSEAHAQSVRLGQKIKRTLWTLWRVYSRGHNHGPDVVDPSSSTVVCAEGVY